MSETQPFDPWKPRTASPPLEQQAFLNLQRSADLLLAELNQLLRRKRLSSPLYNVLRILRGAGPEGLPCREIGSRMIQRDPDVTRLVDRLERLGLVERRRSSDDRRVVRVFATGEGLALLGELDQPVADLHRRQLGRLSADQLARLDELLEAARQRD